MKRSKDFTDIEKAAILASLREATRSADVAMKFDTSVHVIAAIKSAARERAKKVSPKKVEVLLELENALLKDEVAMLTARVEKLRAAVVALA